MSWKPLNLSPSTGAQIPPLLISAAFTSNSYTIRLTDLTNIWSESLDYFAILRRSEKENTSIDPSNRDQLQILLDKIKLGLGEGKDTTIALTVHADIGRPTLILNVAVRLPGSLAPLKWPFILAAAPQSLLKTHLTLPLIQAQYAQIKEIARLAEVLKEKDHVIQKLVDKFEAQGTGLGQLFPQVAGKGGRKVDRKKAEEIVKGLGVFDVELCKVGLSKVEEVDTIDLVEAVFGIEVSLELGRNSTNDRPKIQDDWWENIKDEIIDISPGKIAVSNLSALTKLEKLPTSAGTQFESSIDSIDAFQVKATPPHLTLAATHHGTLKGVIDDSTDDDDDLDGPSQKSKVADSFPSSPPPLASPLRSVRKKLGAVGGKKANAKPTSSVEDGAKTNGRPTSPQTRSPEQQGIFPAFEGITSNSKNSHLGRIEGKKIAALTPDVNPIQAVLSLDAAKPLPSKKGKLGLVGGKKKSALPIAEPNDADEIASSDAGTHAETIGTIGHGDIVTPTTEHYATSGPTSNNDEKNVRPSRKQEKDTTPLLRERSEERADRKREQLKRELEHRAKVPAKKKRKF